MRSSRETHEVSKKSVLSTLLPFIDNNGILRVGGRLQNSEFSFNKKHPVIIPYGCKLAELIIDNAHKKTLHGGNQLTLAQKVHRHFRVSFNESHSHRDRYGFNGGSLHCCFQADDWT